MDILTPIGLLIAFSAIAFGQYLEGGSLVTLLNLPAILIVLGGTLGAALLQTRYVNFLQALTLFKWVIKPPQFPVKEMVMRFGKWSRLVRKSGLLTLEAHIKNIDDYTMVGFDLLLQGMSADQIRNILETELIRRESSRLAGANVFAAMGGYAPTIGIIGAVLGLIEVMRNLHDPTQIGDGIAIAFVASIYGVSLANLFFIPIANKLKSHIEREVNYHELIMEGIVAIAKGESAKQIEYKLLSHGGLMCA